ncbi:MAG: glycine/betaine ABC transporter [Bacteroidetes bacterium]|nr:MAG: glycine/betaine ABC transporter [Bacteroidota bacterium]
MMMKVRIVSAVVAIALLFSACGGGASSSSNGDGQSQEAPAKEVSIAYVDGWAEGVAMTHLATQILQDQGYTVELKKAAVDMVFASLANGDVDVFMDVWLPVTHKNKVPKFGDKIEKVGVNYDQARIGLTVPKYVTLNSIEELNASAEKFEGKIIGIESGAGTTEMTNNAIKDYDLKLEQVNSSTIAMLAEVKKAIDEQRWIVFTGWIPHWMFGRYELKFLEDSKLSYGPGETVETWCHQGFKEADPVAAKFFEQFHLDESQMGDLLVKMEEKGDKFEIAKQWIADHKELVDSWLK